MPATASQAHYQSQFHAVWNDWLPHFEQQFANYLGTALQSDIHSDGLSRLIDAMRHSSLAGGKRLRALLVHLSSQCCEQACGSSEIQSDIIPAMNAHPERIVEFASLSIELIHCYSLIHDDLPALDDDDLRRGKPTCHIAYDEATAILAGDALHSLAYECLSNNATSNAGIQVRLIQLLSKCSGALGMAGGQAIDISCENKRIDIEELTTLHQLKTGKLIWAAVVMGALCGNATREQLNALEVYGLNIGLAFQVRDDIIDITSSSEKLGKPQGADLEADKSTFPSLLGIENASQKAMTYYQNAIDALDIFGPEADQLRGLAAFFVLRDR